MTYEQRTNAALKQAEARQAAGTVTYAALYLAKAAVLALLAIAESIDAKDVKGA